MLLQNLNFMLKSFRKNGAFSLLNVLGLAVGICCALFIAMYVNFELSYDRFHHRYEDIYRVLSTNAPGNDAGLTGITLTALGPAMEQAIPEVEETVRLSANYSGYVSSNEKKFYANSVVHTEDVFFDVFNFPLVQSQSGPLLDRPHAAILTQTFAATVFGDENPLGKVVSFDDQDFEVVAVMQDIPRASHMQFDMMTSLHYLAPGEDGLDELQTDLDSWSYIDAVTYARLRPGASETEVEQKLSTLMQQRAERESLGATLQPLAETHLSSGDILFDFQVSPGDFREILIMASVAVFVLLIAGFNFMNIASARASLRAKEVGVRKSLGATRGQLVRQFLQEAVLMVALAALLALGLMELLQPVVSLSLPEGGLSYLLQHRQLLLVASAALMFVALLAGAYSAFVLSSVSPVDVLKGRFVSAVGGLLFRRVLVVVQFALSIAIIIGTAVVYRQLEFMQSRDPGFSHANIINMSVDDPVLQANFPALKNRLLQLPHVRSVAGSSDMPGDVIPRTSLRPVGSDDAEPVPVGGIIMEPQYLDTLSMNLLAGRNFISTDARDGATSVILNEAAVAALGLQDPVGKAVQWRNELTVVGVVQDFHFYNMHRRIEPLMLLPPSSSPEWNVISVEIDPAAATEVVAGIANVWREINPAYPFEYTWFSDDYNAQFSDEQSFASMAMQFSLVALIIACLGLYGLSAFSADQKTKEIGIRKVMGSSVWQIVLLLTNDFSRLVLMSNLIAWPLAYVAMSRWLETFAYRIDLTPLIFIGSGLIALCIAWVTVGGTAAKAASQKPVLALRYE